MSRGFQSEYLLYVKRRDEEELKSVDAQQGTHAGVKPLNVSCTLAKVVREHGRLVIQRPGLDVSRSPSDRSPRRRGREEEKALNVNEERKKKLNFPAVYEKREIVAKKRASVGLGARRGGRNQNSGSSPLATWSCDPGVQPDVEPGPSTSYIGFSDFQTISSAHKSQVQNPENEVDNISETESSTSYSTTDSEERIAKTLEERVQATHVERKPQDVPLTKCQQPANVNMPSTKSAEKKIGVETLLANRPKRIVVPKSPEDASGLSWTEETQLKKALYASLQESRLQRQTSKQSDVTDGECPQEGIIDNPGEEWSFEIPSSLKLEDMTVVKRGRKRKVESETSSVSSMATSSVTSPTKEQPKYLKPDAIDLKKAQVRAQRKFAQGSRPNSPNITPVKLKAGVSPLPAVAPCKRAKTEDFLTFLCLRGTPALPSHLDFFNYPPDYDDVSSTVSTPKHSRMSFLKRDIRSKSPQSSGSSTADRRDISDKTRGTYVRPFKLASPPKPVKKKRKPNDELLSLIPTIPVIGKRGRKVMIPPLVPMSQLKPRKKRAEVKVDDDLEEKIPILRPLSRPLRRGGPKTRAFLLSKNARQTMRRKVKEVKREAVVEEDVYVDIMEVDETHEKAFRRERAQKVIKQSIKKLRYRSRRKLSRSLRSSTMVQRGSGSVDPEQTETMVKETRSRLSLSPSAPPTHQLPEVKLKRPVGRPRTIKPEEPPSPRTTRGSTTEVKIKSPEPERRKSSRPLRKKQTSTDELFDFDDFPIEIESPRRRRSEVHSQKVVVKPTRMRRMSYGSSVGTRSVSSESRRSTSRESSPEKRARSGLRCSPRIKVNTVESDPDSSSRPVTRRSRASYSELSLDVSGFSDDPESHPKSPSVRSTASMMSTSSVSSLRYSIKSGELSPVGSRGRVAETVQAGKQATQSSNNLTVVASISTPKQSHVARQITPRKPIATPEGKQGASSSGEHLSTPTQRTITPTRKQSAITPSGKQPTVQTGKPAYSPSLRSASSKDDLAQGGRPVATQAQKGTDTLDGNPTVKQTAAPTGKPLVNHTQKPIISKDSIHTSKQTVTQPQKPNITRHCSPTRKQVVAQVGKPTVTPTQRITVTKDSTPTSRQPVAQVEKHVIIPTRKAAINQGNAITVKQGTTPPGKSVGVSTTGKLTSESSGKIGETQTRKEYEATFGPSTTPGKQSITTAVRGAAQDKSGSPINAAAAHKQTPSTVKNLSTNVTPIGKQLTMPPRQAMNASRPLTLSPSKMTPPHSKGTATTLAPRGTLAAPRGPSVGVAQSSKSSVTTSPRASVIPVSPKGAILSVSPRGTQGAASQKVASASAVLKTVTATRPSPVTIAPKTMPVTIMQKSMSTTTASKTSPLTPSRASCSVTVSPRKSQTGAYPSTTPATSRNSIHLVASNKPAVYIPSRSTNIGARIAANPKLNYRSTTSMGTSSMTKAIPMTGRVGTIIKPSAAGTKIPASPDKTSGVNMLLKFASSSARPSANLASTSVENKSATITQISTTKSIVTVTNTANIQTPCVPSNSSNKSPAQKEVISAARVQGTKEKMKVSPKTIVVNKAQPEQSAKVKLVKETVQVKLVKETVNVVKTSSNSTIMKSTSASISSISKAASTNLVTAASPVNKVTATATLANKSPTPAIVKPVSGAEPNLQSTSTSPKAKASVPVRSSIEIVKATSPSHTQDVQLSLVSSTSETASNTSRPVTPVGSQSPASMLQKQKNGTPPKRKRKGPKTIRDLLEARQASQLPRDDADGDGKSGPVLVPPRITPPSLGLGGPPSMVNVMVQGNSVQSTGFPCSLPQVQPVQMVSEGVQTCDEDCEEGSDLPVLTSRKRKMEDEGQGQVSEKKVKEKVRKTKDKMKKIKDIEPSITYVTVSGVPTKEPDVEKAKKSTPETQTESSDQGDGPIADAGNEDRPETPDVLQSQPVRGGKKKAPMGRKRGRQSYAMRSSPATVEDILEAAKNEPAALKSNFPPLYGIASLCEAPSFNPTEQEFQDPMAYIAKIRPEAEKFGMCRIQPPASWKPDCKVHDEMRFTSQIQYIHLTHHRWGPNREKMECIKKHLKSQDVDVDQLPLIGGIELDLPRLASTIQEFGGLQHVLDKKKWNKVADVMGISKLALDRTTKLYDAYCKYLLSYDTQSEEDQEKIRQQVLAEKNSKELEKEKACVIKGRSNSLCGFYRAARNTMAMWFKDDPTSEQAENEYWRLVESGRHHLAVQCGQVDTRVTGSGFPNRKENPYSRHPWNLNVLANNNGSMLRHLGPVTGVTIPTLYVRMLFTSLCWSRDLHLMPFIAYMHSGSDLIWYSVPKCQHKKYKEVMAEMFPDRVDDTPVWLKKDMIMVPPKQLVAKGISVARTIQKQRQFIVVFPEVYTANISCGYNISEQVNLAHPDYIPLGHHAAKMLNESCVPEMFPFEKMLFSLAKNEKVPTDVLCLLVPLLEKVVEEELHYRHQLQSAGLKRSDRMCVIDEPVQTSWKKRRTIDPSEEEDNICEISKKICYISMVVNEAEDVVYSLPHAMPHIQKKKSLKSCKLMYRYSEDELKRMLHNAKERLTNPPEIGGKKRKTKSSTSTSESMDTAPEASTSQ